MIKFIVVWFNKLSGKMKFIVVLIAAICLFGLVQTFRLARSEYLRLKLVEEKYINIQSEQEQSKENQKKILEQNKESTIEVKNKNDAINKKLKKDEEQIDSDSVSNDELIEFISKHERN